MESYGYLQGKKIPCPQVMIEVFLNSPKKSLFNTVAIIDSGASKTCLPQEMITSHAEKYNIFYRTRGVKTATGIQVEAKSYLVDLKVSGYVFRNIEVVALDREYAILGRDILNTLTLTLDGVKLFWEMRR